MGKQHFNLFDSASQLNKMKLLYGSKGNPNFTKYWGTLTPQRYEVELTAAPVGVAKLDVTAGAGRVLPGSLRGEQVLDLGVEGLDGGINLVVLGSQRGLISSVLIISGDIVSTTSGAGRSGQTGKSRRALRWIRECRSQLQLDPLQIILRYTVELNSPVYKMKLSVKQMKTL